MDVEQRIGRAVELTRLIWGASFMAVSAVVGLFLPFYWLLVLLPIGLLTYYGSLALCCVVLASKLQNEGVLLPDANEEELEIDPEALAALHEKLNSGDAEPNEELAEMIRRAGLFELKPMTETGPQFGVFMDKPLFEFVKFMDTKTKEVTQYDYLGPVEWFKHGFPEDKECMNVNGIVYAKPQPEQSDAKKR